MRNKKPSEGPNITRAPLNTPREFCCLSSDLNRTDSNLPQKPLLQLVLIER